jgi:hypothetical protein
MLQLRHAVSSTIGSAFSNREGTVMKKALYVALALMGASAAVFAQQGKPPADAGKAAHSFAEKKQHMLERMDRNIQTMQKHRECLQQAQDEEAARACRPSRMGGKHEGGHMERGAH